MNSGAVISAIVSIVSTLLALLLWWVFGWYRGANISSQTWAEGVIVTEGPLCIIGSILGFIIAFFASFGSISWSTAGAFFWPYAAGYAWGKVISKRELKRSTTWAVRFAWIVTVLAIGVLVAVINISRPFLTIFSSTIAVLNASANQIITGYTLLGLGGFVLSLVFLVTMRIEIPRDIKAFIGETKPSLSDEALRLDIMQRLNRGETASKDNYPDIDLIRIQNIMAALVKDLESIGFNYDASATTLAYRNVEGVRRLHDAYSKADQRIELFTTGGRITAAKSLIQTFVKELGLSEMSSGIRVSNAYFEMATIQAGSLTAVLPASFPVFVPILSDQQIRDKNIRDIFQQIFNKTRPERRFALILSPNSSPLLRNLLTQTNEGEIPENIVFLSEQDVRLIITSNTSEINVAFMDHVQRYVDLTRVSPFIEKGPTKGIVFVGREKEIRTILQNIASRSYVILGGRRIGKTSVLLQIMFRLQKQGYRVLFLECAALSSYHDFYHAIRSDSDWVRELGTYSPIDDLPVTFREVTTALRNQSSRSPLVFVFDEVDGLLTFDRQQEHPEQLFRTFRDLSQTQKCQFIFSGERYIYQQLRDSSSPLFNFCTPMKLGILSQGDAQKLIEEPMALLNITLSGGRILTDNIIDVCSRHPNLIQQLCGAILTHLAQQSKTLRPTITQKMVTDVTSQPQFRADYMDVFWGQSTPLEKAITLLIEANKLVQPRDIASQLQQHGFEIAQNELDIALDYLTLYCVFQHDNEGIKWIATHFDEIANQRIINRQEYIANLREATARLR
jgi:hypothetical protein